MVALIIRACFQYLRDCWDWQLPFFIKFGFPLDLQPNSQIISTKINHKSATANPDHVDQYIREEISHDAMLGPYDTPPFELHTSPFMTRDKANSNNKRVIVDLSWPIGNSVNNGSSGSKYENLEFVLSLPTIDHVIRAIHRFGKGSKIAKINISRAFKHVPIDPKDINF